MPLSHTGLERKGTQSSGVHLARLQVSTGLFDDDSIADAGGAHVPVVCPQVSIGHSQRSAEDSGWLQLTIGRDQPTFLPQLHAAAA